MPAAVTAITTTLHEARLRGISAAVAYTSGLPDADKCPHPAGSPEATAWQAAWDAEYSRQHQGALQ